MLHVLCNRCKDKQKSWKNNLAWRFLSFERRVKRKKGYIKNCEVQYFSHFDTSPLTIHII